jgi:hypothetical protein
MERQAKESGVGIWDASFGTQSESDDSQPLNSSSAVTGEPSS